MERPAERDQRVAFRPAAVVRLAGVEVGVVVNVAVVAEIGLRGVQSAVGADELAGLIHGDADILLQQLQACAQPGGPLVEGAGV